MQNNKTAPAAISSTQAVPQPIPAKSVVIHRPQYDSEVAKAPSHASTPVPATPSSVVPSSAQPLHIKSAMSLVDWRGSITTFNGFTGTTPTQELKDASWDGIKSVLAPVEPATLIDKSKGLFFVPCALKESPLVGNTLEAATKSGRPATGKMRSKQHVTVASMLVVDVDGLNDYDFKAGLAKIIGDGLTVLYYTTYSHGSAEKPGIRARLVVPLDRCIDLHEYAAAWRGFDNHYWGGAAGRADASGANLYQQQGTWCCHPDRTENAVKKEIEAGVASANALIALVGDSMSPKNESSVRSAKNLRAPGALTTRDTSGSNSANENYPISDANKVADACQQIRAFRDTQGAEQSEPEWFNAIGVVGHCEDGADLCQAWSSGHAQYSKQETAKKIAYRLKTPPTTCAQFKSTTPALCDGCLQQCKSPITLGWTKQPQEQFEVVAFTTEIGPRQPSIAKESPENTTAAAPSQSVLSDDDAVIAELAAMRPMDYDRVRREKAKALGVQVSTLDAQVKKVRGGDTTANHLPFPEIEPHFDPIDPAQVLDELVEIIRRYVVMDEKQANSIALWTAFTWFIDVVDVAPIAIITAPEKACGKSQLLTILGYLAARPLPATNSSASFLFRAISEWHPTILIDEADTFIRENDELKGLVNAGHTRANAYVGRTVAVGDGHEPKMFDVWGAKAFAGIALERHLPDATMSRGVVISLRRKMPNETVSRLRHADRKTFTELAAKLARFADDYSQQVRLARPELPDELGDRDQDNWEPLLAIAQCAGPEWVKRATEAALVLSRKNEESVSTGNELLSDIQHVFESKGVNRISTADLIAALIADEEKPWATYNRGNQLTPRQLSRQLAAYSIKTKTVRFGHGTPKGFELAQFQDAFARYLGAPQPATQQRNDTPETSNGKVVGEAEETQQVRLDTETPIAMTALDCGGVAAVSPPPASDAEKPSRRALEDKF